MGTFLIAQEMGIKKSRPLPLVSGVSSHAPLALRLTALECHASLPTNHCEETHS